MSKYHLGFLPSEGAEAPSALADIPESDLRQASDLGQATTQPSADASSVVSAADHAQLARDIAAIERASTALRRAEPALESWTEAPTAATQKSRPVWLLIGVLWLSTALVTIGAVFAISALVG
jgi:hypothetical protein